MQRRLIATDPRIFQIAALTSLLLYGLFALDFPIRFMVAMGVVSAALLTEYCLNRNQFDPLSPLISALSLCLLLRSDSVLIATLAGALAITSKRVIRFDGRHLFNPSAFALVVSATLFDGAWISPGQ